MEKVICFCLALSALLFSAALFGILFRFVRYLLQRPNRSIRLVRYLLLILLAIWSLRFAVGYYSNLAESETGGGQEEQQEEQRKLGTWEVIFDSLTHAFQSFSMDEDYSEYIANGKNMVAALRGEDSALIGICGFYTAFLNVLAPVCGGAILLDIVQGVFPGIMFFIKKLLFWKKKYFFSELNEASLAAARSIHDRRTFFLFRPVIVFTDVYTDGEDEKSSELLKKAKALGAVCLNDDLTHVSPRFSNKKEYWLIDENEIDNIKTLAELANDRHYKTIHKTIIRIFYHDDSYSLTEAGIIERIRGRYQKKLESDIKKGKKSALRKLKIAETEVLSKRIREERKKQEARNTETEALPKLTGKKSLKLNVKDAAGKLREQIKRPAESLGIWANKTFRLDAYLDRLHREYLSLLGKTEEEAEEKDGLDEKAEGEAIERVVDLKAPAVIRTRCYQDLIYHLMEDHPLYEPLLGREGDLKLDVAILGNGNIGMEMFLTSYWCGQLYHIPLSINMVAIDGTEDVVGKINMISSEILKSTEERWEELRVYEREDHFNEPYFTFRYCGSNVDTADISSIVCTDPISEEHGTMALTDADYYLVALGEDDLNIRTAERLMKAVAIRQMELKVKKDVTIAYVVYDSNLFEALNQPDQTDGPEASEKTVNVSGAGKIRMIAVGSIDETYGYDNIINSRYAAKKISKENGKFTRSDWVTLANMRSVSSRPYEFWSSNARDIHYQYKLFSAYLIGHDPSCGWEDWKKNHEEYICETASEEPADMLAWLEHRRWNAYMRSIGFQKGKKDVKFLKTHDCLVERKDPQDPYQPLPEHSKDCLEIVKDAKIPAAPHLIDYDYAGIVPEAVYNKMIGQ